MQGPEVEDAALERIISAAADGDEEALDELFRQEFLYVLLYMIADWAWRKYKVEHDRHGRDVQDVVGGTIRRKITTLKNPRRVSWRAVLKSWCYTVAKRHCLNVLRDERFADEYRDSVVHENTECKRGGRKIVTPCSTLRTEAEQRRQESVTEGQIKKIDQTVREIFDSLTPEEKTIASQWSQNKTLQQIADETGSSVETVRRKLKKLQKTLVKELGTMAEEIGKASDTEVAVADVQENLLAHRAQDLRKLLAAGLYATAGPERRVEADS
ncbi:MAG TPA: sigma-70 family RNA polymerase sigma factor [Pyrinomonadaceae bacterium]|nr:sigma-70 family RNA polymerase sigma factor [Pyrinomonadaceae bacterium]